MAERQEDASGRYRVTFGFDWRGTHEELKGMLEEWRTCSDADMVGYPARVEYLERVGRLPRDG